MENLCTNAVFYKIGEYYDVLWNSKQIVLCIISFIKKNLLALFFANWLNYNKKLVLAIIYHLPCCVANVFYSFSSCEIKLYKRIILIHSEL